MKAPKSLLAKKPSDREKPSYQETLVGHISMVCQAADVLTEALGPPLREATLCSESDLLAWKNAVSFASWAHDWGKANDHFLRLLTEPGSAQGVRHELLSIVIASEIDEWLEPIWKNLPRWAKSAAFFAIAGHHLKFPDPFEGSRTGTSVTVFLSHPEFAAVLEMGRERFRLPEAPKLADKAYSLLRSGDLKRIVRSIRKVLDEDDFNPAERVLIAATKSTLMSADLCGSALPKVKDDPAGWLNERLGKVLSPEDLENVVGQRLRGCSPRPFQQAVRDAATRTALVEAGCGTGKTAAAYLWASRFAAGRRLFFCYPTTGTASEGFAGYLQDPDFDALLIHSRAPVDYRLLDNMPDPNREERDLREAGLEALETYPIPTVVCTVYTVLGMLENVRRGLCAWPSLIRSAFVFDEIHSYSNRLFSYLLRFLTAMPGVPVLLMTATLPPTRRKALETCADSRGGIVCINGPAERESAPRYRLHLSSTEDAWERAVACVSEGEKVLWVCNTVARAMELVDTGLAHKLPVQPYHSRYAYRDRLKRHRTVIDSFKRGKPSVFAITTQVAEMSLDLSADLLVSEVAPVPSMIQRMGRLNRYEEQPRNVCDALFVRPESMLPYGDEDMHGVDGWFQRVANGEPQSQADLATAFVQVWSQESSPVAQVEYCEWLDGLWRSLKDQRAIEEAGYTVEVIRQEDLDSAPAAEVAIPMPVPKGRDWQEWPREGRYLVVPRGEIVYDPFRGAQWRNPTNSR